MLRSILALVALVACGGKHSGQSLCAIEQPPPAGCNTACGSGGSMCPAGLFCNNGHCDQDCTSGGNQCPSGEMCASDGQCVPTSTGPDADCPSVHFTPTHTMPSVELLLDRSGSMNMSDISPTRYSALHTALTGAMGAVTSTQGSVYFGAALFSGAESPCPPNANLDGFSVPRALNNASAINTLIAANGPSGSTPTAVWIQAITADFSAHPPPMGSPPIILLATDGEPNGCGTSTNDNGASVAAAKAAYAAGIRLFIIGLANLNTTFLQQMANAGAGVTMGPNAPFYTANDPASLSTAFNTIINGVLSCDLALTGHIDPSQAQSGTVTLDGMTLAYGTDWTLDPNGMVIHLLGTACNKLKSSTNPTVDAQFPCGAVIF
jgi:hypothetical protein